MRRISLGGVRRSCRAALQGGFRALLCCLFLATALGCGSSGGGPAAPEAPLAVNDDLPALGNASVEDEEASGVLANDAVNGAVITAFDATGTQGGALVLHASGNFLYTPVTGFIGAESFSYTLTNSLGESTATITFTSVARGWFVDNTASTGDGTEGSPFTNLQDALDQAQSGDTVFVFYGDGTPYEGDITVPAGVSLIGEAEGLTVGLRRAAAPLPQSKGIAVPRPPPSNQPGMNGIIRCESGTRVAGLRFPVGPFGNAGAVTILMDGARNVAILNNSFSRTRDGVIRGTDVAGQILIANNIFDRPATGSDVISITNTDSNADIVITDNTFKNSSWDAGSPSARARSLAKIYATGTSTIGLTFSRNTATSTEQRFGAGLDSDFEGRSTATVTVENNSLRGFAGIMLEIDSRDDAVLSGRVAGNTLVEAASDGILVTGRSGTFTVQNNTITDVGDDGIQLRIGFGGATILILDNVITRAGFDGIFCSDGESSDASIVLRGNTIRDSSDDSIDIRWSGSGNMCIDVTGNTVDDDMEFNASGATGEFNVEQLGILDTVNTFLAGVVTTTGTVNDRPNGFCSGP